MTLAGDINETGHLDDGIFPSFSMSCTTHAASNAVAYLNIAPCLPALSKFGLVIMGIVNLF